jgi:hypothetical protein
MTTSDENIRRIIEFRIKNSLSDRGGMKLSGNGISGEKEYACIHEQSSGVYRFFSIDWVSDTNRQNDKWYIFRTDMYGTDKDTIRASFFWGMDGENYRHLLNTSREYGQDWAPVTPYVDKYILAAWDAAGDGVTSSYYFDWFFVKKWATTEPSVTVGSEQTVPPAGTSINLVAGWNLVGFSAVGPSDAPNSIFAPLVYNDNYIMYYWNAPAGPYSGVDPTQPLKDNQGYWVNMFNTNKTVSTSGTRPTSENIHLKKGWNMVSFPIVDNTTTPNKIFAPLNYSENYIIYYWNAPAGPYALQGSDQLLKDNLGYWVWIDQDWTVSVP